MSVPQSITRKGAAKMYVQLLVFWDTNIDTGENSATGRLAIILAFAFRIVIGKVIYNFIHKKTLLQSPSEITVLKASQ